MAFFSKADAKVRTFFEPPKLFGRNFQKSFFQWRFVTLIFVSVFQLICVSLSKAGAKVLLYGICTKLSCLFFRLKCTIFPKSLILKRCRTAGFHCAFLYIQTPIPYYLYARVHKQTVRITYTPATGRQPFGS